MSLYLGPGRRTVRHGAPAAAWLATCAKGRAARTPCKDLAYASVPDALTARSEQFIRQITVDGQPAFPEK